MVLPITMGAGTQRCHVRRPALASQRDGSERTLRKVDGDIGDKSPLRSSTIKTCNRMVMSAVELSQMSRTL